MALFTSSLKQERRKVLSKSSGQLTVSAILSCSEWPSNHPSGSHTDASSCYLSCDWSATYLAIWLTRSLCGLMNDRSGRDVKRIDTPVFIVRRPHYGHRAFLRAESLVGNPSSSLEPNDIELTKWVAQPCTRRPTHCGKTCCGAECEVVGMAKCEKPFISAQGHIGVCLL